MLRHHLLLLCAIAVAACDVEPPTNEPDTPGDDGAAEADESAITRVRISPELSYALRARDLLERAARVDLLPEGDGFVMPAIAKLAVASPGSPPLRDINQRLLDFTSTREPGTDFEGINVDIPGGPTVHACGRRGDYDFTLRGLTTIAYAFGPRGAGANRNKLEPAAYQRLLDVLLTERGGAENVRLQVSLCNIGFPAGIPALPETENHILQTEISRFLTNQLLHERDPGDARWRNDDNGMREWMLRHLRHFLVDDFYEYNARPYALHTWLAIQNLYEYSEDTQVKTSAHAVLDYLAAKFAISSNSLRRNPPYRRRPENYSPPTLLANKADELMHVFTLLAGPPPAPLTVPERDSWDGALSAVAMGTYRLPRAIRELALDKSGFSYFQRFSHDTAEVYASSPEVLISAGGEWAPPAFRLPRGIEPILNYAIDAINKKLDEDAGLAAATTLIPTRNGDRVDQMIRFLGHTDDHQRRSTCVAPDFACGTGMMIPDVYLSCAVHHDDWYFIDATCSRLNLGFYAAARMVRPYGNSGSTDRLQQFGMVEVLSARAMSFVDFQLEFVARNGGRSYVVDGVNEHLTISGRRILFTPNPRNGRDTIHTISDGYFDGMGPIQRWPLAQGDLMNGGGGFIEITHPTLGDRIVLDLRDPLAPSRTEVSGTAWATIGGPIQVGAAPMEAGRSFTALRDERTQRLMLLAIGTDNTLQFKNQSAALDWGGWDTPRWRDGTRVHGGWIGRIAAVSRAHGLFVYAIGGDAHVYVQRGPFPDWTGWQMIPRGGGLRVVDLDVLAGTNADQTVVVVDDEGAVHLQDVGDAASQRYPLHGVSYSGWFPLGRPDPVRIQQVSVTRAADRLHIVGLAEDGSIWRRRQIIEMRTSQVFDPLRWTWVTATNPVWSWGPWQRLSNASFCGETDCFSNRMIQVEAAHTALGSPGGERLAVLALREDGRAFRTFITDVDGAVDSSMAFEGGGSTGIALSPLPFTTPLAQLAAANNAEGEVGRGRLEVFGLDRAGRVWNVWQAGLGDDAWQGPLFRTDDRPLVALSAAVNARGPIEIFGVDPITALVRHDWQDWQLPGYWYR